METSTVIWTVVGALIFAIVGYGLTEQFRTHVNEGINKMFRDDAHAGRLDPRLERWEYDDTINIPRIILGVIACLTALALIVNTQSYGVGKLSHDAVMINAWGGGGAIAIVMYVVGATFKTGAWQNKAIISWFMSSVYWTGMLIMAVAVVVMIVMWFSAQNESSKSGSKKR